MDLLLMWIFLIKMREVYQTLSTVVFSSLFEPPERQFVATLRTLVAVLLCSCWNNVVGQLHSKH
jgi:hypothetical protein